MALGKPKSIGCVSPSAEAVLESLALLIARLEPVASRDTMTHLWGIRRYVVAQHEALGNDGTTDGD